ncbi:M20 family metallopeptidase [Robiginitalea sp. SC105]|uniref:M20 family metallopeptidase n=1 Tax=Robiginitalea sp. SC105 TaxID=2762332 RepID=UPI00163A3AAD|nr:M20 family metallopeptidase [Robiginitalea sp. SC105]MBC2839554.1 M20 family metallopeptidase [Robiginitalea sp. SC105]
MTSDQSIKKQLLPWFSARKGDMLAFLKELAAMETPSSDPGAQQGLMDWVGGRFEELGMYVLKVPGARTGGYLYARSRNRKRGNPLQLLLGHCDTVWPGGTLPGMPIRQEDGRLSGPGIYDMKAGITQIYFALRCLKDLSIPVPVTPVVFINSDEEIGSPESTAAIRRLARLADRAYVLEPPLGPDGRLKTARKGLGRFTLTVNGRAAHAGLDPEKGVNAIVEMASLVQQVYKLNDFERGITVNVGLIEGGISPNTVAPTSRVVLDVRVPDFASGRKVEEAIHGLQPSSDQIGLEIDGGFGRPPMERTPRNRRLWLLADATGRELGLELRQAAAGGGSDANTTSLFTATLDGLGIPGDGAHASHEHIRTRFLEERTALLTLLILLGPLKQN